MSIKEEYDNLKAQKDGTPIEDRLQRMIDAIETGATNGWQRTSFNLYEDMVPSKLTESRDRLWAHLLEQRAEKTKSPEDKSILNTIAAITRRKMAVKGNPALLMVFTAAECLCISAYLTKDKGLKTAVMGKARSIIGFPTRVSEQTNEPLVSYEAHNPNKQVMAVLGNNFNKYQEALWSIQKTIKAINETLLEVAQTKDIENKQETFTALYDIIKEVYHQITPVEQALFDIFLDLIAKIVPIDDTPNVDDDVDELYEENEEDGYYDIFEEE